MSFHERMRTLRVLVEELSDKLGDVLCSIAFGSFIRGRMDFKDVDLFILTRTEHYIENSLITNSLTVEIHLMSLKELEALKNEKILYGIWRDGFLLNGDPTPIFHKLKSFLKKHGWKVDNLRIERARLGLEDARRKLEEYKRARTDVERAYHLSTACEHAFHSAVTALEELLIKEKYPIPSNHGERFRLLEELSKKKSKIAKLKLKERLGSLFTDLHVRGYYRSTLNIEEAEKCIRKVERYVRDIEELLDGQ
jgi:HEPN domain-containing protein